MQTNSLYKTFLLLLLIAGLYACSPGPSPIVYYPHPIESHKARICNDLLAGDWKVTHVYDQKPKNNKKVYVEVPYTIFHNNLLRFKVNQFCDNSSVTLGLAGDTKILQYFNPLTISHIAFNRSHFLQVKISETTSITYALFKVEMQDNDTIVLYYMTPEKVKQAIHNKKLAGKIKPVGRGTDPDITATGAQLTQYLIQHEQELFTTKVTLRRVQTQIWQPLD